MNDSVLDLLLRNLRERRSRLEEDLARGKCETMQEYKSKTGEIAGILFAEREILDMKDRIE